MFVMLVFTRLNDSRIGRGWVAIREDERAAEAMGVNVFGLKLLAFAVGAFLAGLAGTIKAHQDTSVSPDQYVFLESAFLLAGRRPRWHGHRDGRARRRHDPQAAPREAARGQRLPAAHLRPAARRHDALPPGGPGAEQAAPAGVPRGGRPSSSSSSRPSTSRRRNDRHRDPDGRRAPRRRAGRPRGQRRDDALRRPHRRRRRRA